MTREQKIRRVQLGVGVTVDGEAGDETWDAIYTRVIGAPPPADAPPVEGGQKLLPLSSAQRAKLFGDYKFEPAPTAAEPDAIRILGSWEAINIVRVELPELAAILGGKYKAMRFHAKAAKQLRALWTAWAEAGLLHHILSYEGAFCARYLRGARPARSNHAFGTAFDLNAQWNGLRETPAGWNSKGTVRPLVELAEAHGFFWGGNFATRKDGMHFEVARILS